MKSLTHGSLFSGIGGFEKGAQMEGIETIWNSEIETYQQKILKKKFPNTLQYGDIKELTKPRQVDIISGGFPCQDISINGKGAGIKGERSGLWSEMFRIIRQIRPKYAIIENSPALLIRGFEEVLCDLSQIGYDAEWQCISNVAFGYPHKRERLYAIAYSNKERFKSNICENVQFNSIFKRWTPKTTDGYSCAKRFHEISACKNIRTDDGFRNWTHRVGALGNAVNVTVARYLFECIKIDYQQQIEFKNNNN